MTSGDTAEPRDRRPDTGWRSALALTIVAYASSLVYPGVLIAVPFLFLAGRSGMRSPAMLFASALAVWVVSSGERDGLWYAERAWALFVAGWFLAASLAYPGMRLSGRLLGAVFGACASGAALLAVRSGSWDTLDFAVSDQVSAGIAHTLDAMAILREGEALPPLLVTALYETAELQVAVFPAMLAIASMASVAVAWWLHGRLSGRIEERVGPLRDFRFNDHLIWILICGALLLVTRWSDAVARVGSNLVAFMGALYVLRGAAVFAFVNGGLSWLGVVLVLVGLVVAAPVLIGVALMVGIGDTWLDVRSRIREVAA